MKIAIDVSQIVYGTGVSVYTKGLVENILRLDDKNQYILFGGSLRRIDELKDFFRSLKGNFVSKVYPLPPTLADIIWNRMHILPIESLLGKVDVFHSSDWSQPPTNALKITTVHDLFSIKYPKLTNPKVAATQLRRLRRVLKEVDWVIVPSQTTREDLKTLGFERNISVIPEAPDPIYKPSTKLEIQRVKRKYQIIGDYLISVGVNQRKNTPRIISAFEKVRPGLDLKLVIVGQPFMKLEPTRGVKMLGHVDIADLPPLYSGAMALVFPSLYEGFGFPILQAFCCSLPVVTSNLGTMKEIGQGAAILVDPEDTNSIAEGVKTAIKERESLVKKGHERLKNYNWRQVAEETIKIYNKVGKY